MELVTFEVSSKMNGCPNMLAPDRGLAVSCTILFCGPEASELRNCDSAVVSTLELLVEASSVFFGSTS